MKFATLVTLLAGATLLTGCATTLDWSGAKASDDAERVALAGLEPGIARRDRNRTLTLFPGTSTERKLRDVHPEEHPDEGVVYHFDRRFGTNIVGVRLGFYEGSDYVLFSRDGTALSLGQAPLVSPDGHKLAAFSFSESHPSDEGINVVDLSGGRLMRLFYMPSGAQPGTLAAYENARWVTDRCIQFDAQTVGADGGWGDVPQRTHHIAENAGRWSVSEGTC